MIVLIVLLSTSCTSRKSVVQEGPKQNSKSTYTYRWDKTMHESLGISYDSIGKWKMARYDSYQKFQKAKANLSHNTLPTDSKSYQENKKVMDDYFYVLTMTRAKDIKLDRKNKMFSFTTPVPFWIDMNKKALEGVVTIEKLDNLHSKVTYKDDIYLTEVTQTLTEQFDHILMNYYKSF